MTAPGSLQDDADTPAVNHAGGIARLMGDGALFARVLARFRNEYRQAAAGIHGALEGGDIQLALRLVHTLKGAAGMIEAVPLRRQAQALEQMLRTGGGDPYRGVARLEEELERVLRELDVLAGSMPERHAAMPPAGSPTAAAPATQSEQDDALERLVRLLDEGNGDAVDVVRDAGAALAARLGEERYLRLSATVEAFDFDGALALLGKTPSGG